MSLSKNTTNSSPCKRKTNLKSLVPAVLAVYFQGVRSAKTTRSATPAASSLKVVLAPHYSRGGSLAPPPYRLFGPHVKNAARYNKEKQSDLGGGQVRAFPASRGGKKHPEDFGLDFCLLQRKAQKFRLLVHTMDTAGGTDSELQPAVGFIAGRGWILIHSSLLQPSPFNFSLLPLSVEMKRRRKKLGDRLCEDGSSVLCVSYAQ